MEDLLNLLGADRYLQHAVCLTNDPAMLLLYVTGDLVTAWSYLTMGLLLMIKCSLPTRMELKFLYGAFILLCGLSHLTEVLTLFWGIYRLDVVVTVAMAVVSAATAVTTILDAHREG